jgi:hypothetical protein
MSSYIQKHYNRNDVLTEIRTIRNKIYVLHEKCSLSQVLCVKRKIRCQTGVARFLILLWFTDAYI